MTVTQFIKTNKILDEKEIEKVKLLAYHYKVKANSNEFTFTDIDNWFMNDLGHVKPQKTRLKSNLLKSKDFVRGQKEESFKLNPKTFELLETKFQFSSLVSEEIITNNSILPESLYTGTRGYIVSISKQINASFEYNISDGCAVLMRRLLEICLILAYKNLGIENAIQNPDGSFKMLDPIINDATTNSTLSLSKDTKSILNDFKELGNFSAHKIHYNCRKSEIQLISRKYRATIEELFYKSGLKA